jgi:hypothetical protein
MVFLIRTHSLTLFTLYERIKVGIYINKFRKWKVQLMTLHKGPGPEQCAMAPRLKMKIWLTRLKWLS